MDAVEFLKEMERMCEKGCIRCALSAKNNGKAMLCNDFCTNFPEEAIKEVERFAKDNPKKTIAEEFKEKYPNAMLKQDGSPVVCALKLGYKVECTTNCSECWNTLMEE